MFRRSIWTNPTLEVTTQILNLIVENYHDYFTKKPLPGRPSIPTLYAEISKEASLNGIVITPKEI